MPTPQIDQITMYLHPKIRHSYAMMYGLEFSYMSYDLVIIGMIFMISVILGSAEKTFSLT